MIMVPPTDRKGRIDRWLKAVLWAVIFVSLYNVIWGL